MIPYFIKLSIGLSVVFMIYWVFLRRMTFYNWNRWYLLLFSVAAFLLPLVNITSMLSRSSAEPALVTRWIPSIESATGFDSVAPVTTSRFVWTDLFPLIFIAGVLFLLVRLSIQFISFYRMRKQATLMLDDAVKLYYVNGDILPFSFANSIFINPSQHEDDELKEIIRHEFIHVREKHSIDILLGEIICLLSWYNPFAWFIRNAIRQNLEFIADEMVLRQGFDRKQYQYLLLKVVGVSKFSIASNFNFSSLKKRIAMMNKNKTARAHLSRFLLVLPVLAVVLLAFRKEPIVLPMFGQLLEDTIPAPPKPSKPNLPANVKGIHINNEKATVTLKSGEKEYYDLSTDEGKKNFEAKYGPIPEPPVPPVAPIAPAPDVVPFGDQVPIPETPAVPNEYRQFLKKNPGVKKLSWTSEPDAVLVHLKSGKLEVYQLDNKQQMEAAEKKYGKFPHAAPLPPSPPAPPSPPSAPNPPADDNQPNSVQIANPDIRIEKIAVEMESTASIRKVAVASPDLTPSQAIILSNDMPMKVAVQAKTATTIAADIITVEPAIRVEATDAQEKLFEINKHTTRKDLQLLEDQLAAKGYKLKIDNANFNDGMLESISGSIRDKNSNSYFTATEFNKVVVSLVSKGNKRKGFLIQIFEGKIKVQS